MVARAELKLEWICPLENLQLSSAKTSWVIFQEAGNNKQTVGACRFGVGLLVSRLTMSMDWVSSNDLALVFHVRNIAKGNICESHEERTFKTFLKKYFIFIDFLISSSPRSAIVPPLNCLTCTSWPSHFASSSCLSWPMYPATPASSTLSDSNDSSVCSVSQVVHVTWVDFILLFYILHFVLTLLIFRIVLALLHFFVILVSSLSYVSHVHHLNFRIFPYSAVYKDCLQTLWDTSYGAAAFITPRTSEVYYSSLSLGHLLYQTIWSICFGIRVREILPNTNGRSATGLCKIFTSHTSLDGLVLARLGGQK